MKTVLYTTVKLYNNYIKQRELDNMATIYYEDIEVGEVVTNQSLTVDRALELIGFDEEEFLKEHGFEALDYNDFKIEY